MESGRDSARARHGGGADRTPDLEWIDLFNIMREEPIAARGALAFGLKPVAKAIRGLGLIETDRGDSQVDGFGAIVDAWSRQKEARDRGVSMAELPLMREIAEYNHIDCKAMMEIVRYLRANH